MGCNCGSKVAANLRNSTITTKEPTVVVPKKPDNFDAMQQEAKAARIDPRKALDTTLCPVCKSEIIYRLEHVRNTWVKTKWCPHCKVRINVL